MSMFKDKVVYISGPITGVENYWEAFKRVEDFIEGQGGIALSPIRLPAGLSNEQYMRMDIAQIDSADIVCFITGWEKSRGARLEHAYCEYIDKEMWYEIIIPTAKQEVNYSYAYCNKNLKEDMKNE